MRNFKIISNGGEGVLIIGKDPVSKQDVIKLGFNNKMEFLDFYWKMRKFATDNYQMKIRFKYCN